MLLHAAAARVPDGGCIHLYGAGHEGIRSAAKHFPAGSGRVRTVLVKRRCRVLAATRGAPPPRADALDSWEIRAPIDWGTGPRDWTFYPGVFACGRLDPATKLLIEQLPGVVAGAWRAVARRAGGEAGRTNGDAGRADEKSVSGRDGARGGRRLRVLDFGAGAGAVGAAVLDLCGGVTTNDNTSQRQESGDPRPHVTLLERDAIALAAAARNVPAATLVLGSRVSHAHGPLRPRRLQPPDPCGGRPDLRRRRSAHRRRTPRARAGRPDRPGRPAPPAGRAAARAGLPPGADGGRSRLVQGLGGGVGERLAASGRCAGRCAEDSPQPGGGPPNGSEERAQPLRSILRGDGLSAHVSIHATLDLMAAARARPSRLVLAQRSNLPVWPRGSLQGFCTNLPLGAVYHSASVLSRPRDSESIATMRVVRQKRAAHAW